jgi:hypothetical protein
LVDSSFRPPAERKEKKRKATLNHTSRANTKSDFIRKEESEMIDVEFIPS